MPSDSDLATAVRAPVHTIADVLAVMEAIQESVPSEDGIGWFNRLYHRTTKNIQAALAEGRFVDADWTAQLDVVFARYYFSAIDRFLQGSADTPHAWSPLFERRSSNDIAPMQFALAGMNAHINRDLSFALVDMASASNAMAARSSARHGDYETVNAILVETERQVKEWLEGAFLRQIEFEVGRIEDVIAIWSVEHARDAAWTRAETQWEVRGINAIASGYATVIDKFAGLATRALLLPTRILA